MKNNLFNNKKANTEKLLKFGFSEENNSYIYSKELLEGEFELTVTVNEDGLVSAKVTDTFSKEPYTLHLVADADGKFVGKIKDEYENILKKIADECFENDIFKSDFSKKVIKYARKKYGDELEYLWEKFPNNAVIRRKDNAKWYAAILTVQKNKLGLEGSEIIEIIDLRANPDEIDLIVDNKKYFRGYHMNKKHWITIILDGSVNEDELYRKIDDSYILANKS